MSKDSYDRLLEKADTKLAAHEEQKHKRGMGEPRRKLSMLVPELPWKKEVDIDVRNAPSS